MTYLALLETVVLAGSAVLVVYGFLLSFAGRIRGSGKVPLIFPRHVFALVVPVGNDEGTIGRTVDHLRRNKYTRSMFDVIIAPVNCTDQTPTIARRKGAVVYGPGNQRWSDADEAVHGVLERLATKDRYDAYVILDVRSRISANFLAVMSDRLSRGALAVQSGYSVSGRKWTWNTASRALLSALKPCWLTSWPLNLRLAGGIHRTGLCISRRLVEKTRREKPPAGQRAGISNQAAAPRCGHPVYRPGMGIRPYQGRKTRTLHVRPPEIQVETCPRRRTVPDR